MVTDLDILDKELLNILQSRFPLNEEPFKQIARELETSEDDVIARTRELKARRVLRQISAIFDSRGLGYQSSLVAGKAAPGRLDEAAQVINAHPGVSHNYARNHDFNLWFTITLPPGQDLEETVNNLARRAGLLAVRLLPTLRLFKIGVEFDMLEGVSASKGSTKAATVKDTAKLTPLEVEIVRQLQKDLPLDKRPFRAMAEAVGISESELLRHANSFLHRGVMRRYAAVLRHQNAGFRANGMICWLVPEAQVEEIGNTIASFRAVSHCYQRPSYPDWPYSIFSMVHARSRAEVEQIVAEMSKTAGLEDYVVLYSAKEYKKERVRYFPDN